MTSTELKNYIIEHEQIEYILESLGCRSIVYHEDKNYYSAIRPDENADNKMGVIIKAVPYLNYFSYSKNIHKEDGKDLFALVQETKHITFSETMKYIHKLLGLKYTFKKEEPKDDKPKYDPLAIFKKAASKKRCRNVLDCTFEALDESVLTDLVPMIHIDLFRYGITPRTIKKFGLAYSYKFKRTIMPYRYWATGELMGYTGRTSIENHELFDIPKYYISKSMNKSITLYGLYENYESIQKAGYVVVYESEKSTLRRHSLFDETGVSIAGHSLSDEQVAILIGLNVDIIISMDTDVDLQEIRHMCHKFYRIRNVYYTYDKHHVLPDKSSIVDASDKVFQHFIKFKIKYDENEEREYLKGIKNKS